MPADRQGIQVDCTGHLRSIRQPISGERLAGADASVRGPGGSSLRIVHMRSSSRHPFLGLAGLGRRAAHETTGTVH